jgi:dephospho-CoA kinase
VVTAPRDIQIERLCRTRNMTPAEAITRIDAQTPQADKVAVADVVISNQGDIATTLQQVLVHWQAIFPHH